MAGAFKHRRTLPVAPVRFDGMAVSDEEIPRSLPPPVRALARSLRARVSGEVRFDAGTRAAYSTDASNYRQVPIGVVLPRSVDDVIEAVAACREHGAPVTSRGGGTSLAGQACNAAVILDFSKYMHAVIRIDPRERLAVVEPGCVLDRLRREAARHGLTFGPDPATHDHNTLGGMIGNDSCGVHSVMAQHYGPGPLTRHQVRELEILTYDGERLVVGPTSDAELAEILAAGGRRGQIYADLVRLRDAYADEIRARYPDIPRRVSGYNLDALLPERGLDVAQALVGTEGTCAVVLRATVTLIDRKPARALLVLGYPDAYAAADHVTEVMRHEPVGLEGMDDELISYVKKKQMNPDGVALLPEGAGWLLVEFGADTADDARAQARAAMAALEAGGDPPAMKLIEDETEQAELWEVRESGLGATARVPGMKDTHPGWEDAAVPPQALGSYLRRFRALLDEFGYQAALYGHFGQGCVHCRIDFDLTTVEGVATWRAFLDRAADLVVACGGSLSGEHGDGQSRAALLPKMYGDDLVRAFREFKRIWDPDGRMNPGKVVDARAPDDDLRAGPGHAPPRPATHFSFADDDGSFSRAAARCVGVGTCRREDTGTMCPSYMVTREEEHSTRGRARALFEMLRGDVVARGWRDPHVKRSLDLCLSCKGCKSDCPVSVDMATYKAEFLAHYYKGRLRPRAAYSMGLIRTWARIGSRIPRLANFLARTRPLSTALKWLGGVARARRIPAFARVPFRRWFEPRRRATADAAPAPLLTPGPGDELRPQFGPRRVLLWPDTFTNYFEPEVAAAATRVLEAAGYRVDIPPRPLCCGRPLYDWGWLDRAKRRWRENLDALRPYVRAGVPIVGLEPSCVAAFRDELVGLMPGDDDAARLADQTLLLSELLDRDGYQPPLLRRRAVVHGHCHHVSVLGFDPEVALLSRLGLDFQLLDAGCCGMAGAFGFEDAKYEVSVRAGERALLPAVRAASADTLIIADGFSCREQIAQCTGRKAVHVAQVLEMALDHAAEGARDAAAGADPDAAARRARTTRRTPGRPDRHQEAGCPRVES